MFAYNYNWIFIYVKLIWGKESLFVSFMIDHCCHFRVLSYSTVHLYWKHFSLLMLGNFQVLVRCSSCFFTSFHYQSQSQLFLHVMKEKELFVSKWPLSPHPKFSHCSACHIWKLWPLTPNSVTMLHVVSLTCLCLWCLPF